MNVFLGKQDFMRKIPVEYPIYEVCVCVRVSIEVLISHYKCFSPPISQFYSSISPISLHIFKAKFPSFLDFHPVDPSHLLNESSFIPHGEKLQNRNNSLIVLKISKVQQIETVLKPKVALPPTLSPCCCVKSSQVSQVIYLTSKYIFQI
jgi:hypothetical protein